MAGLAMFDARRDDAATIAACVEERAYAIVTNLLDAEQLARVKAELDPHIENVQLDGTPFLGARTKRVSGLFTKSRMIQQMAIHPLVLGVADLVMLPWCVRYQYTFGGVMHLLPGEGSQELHRDGYFYPFRHPAPPLILGCMWAITDFTAENGATAIVPGSNTWPAQRKARPEEVVPAVMPAGSGLLYTSAMIHGGGSNRSDAARCGVNLQYSLGWLRQQENQSLACPPEVARDFPERLQRLIGYDLFGPYLGFVASDDPHRLLEPPDPNRPRRRTDDAIDARHIAIHKLTVGDTTPGDNRNAAED